MTDIAALAKRVQEIITMAAHDITALAQAVHASLTSAANLKPATDALYAELGSFTVAQAINTGAGGELLICLPGYSPLSNPTDFVHPAVRVE